MRKFESLLAVATLTTLATAATAMPVEYAGQLVDGTPVLGAVSSSGGVDDPASGIYFWFSGNAGDIVTITVARLEQDLDPALWLFEGRMDDTARARAGAMPGFDKGDAGFLRHADDEIAHEGGFGDPQILAFELPTTGYYTAVVTNFLSRNASADGWFDFAIDCEGCSLPAVVVTSPGTLASIALGVMALGAVVWRRRMRHA